MRTYELKNDQGECTLPSLELALLNILIIKCFGIILTLFDMLGTLAITVELLEQL